MSLDKVSLDKPTKDGVAFHQKIVRKKGKVGIDKTLPYFRLPRGSIETPQNIIDEALFCDVGIIEE